MNSTSQTLSKPAVFPVFLYAGTLFLSALLMFALQPMFGKILLPMLGGTPAVWNSCMVFYQSLLFLGYLYAHWLSSGFQIQRQIHIHSALLLFSLLALPVALQQGVTPPTDNNPTFWLIHTLLIAIGIPFFVVSSTAPLLQKWFSHCGHHQSHDPYFLYAASNAGSLLALLSYPFLIEPLLGLAGQRLYWSLGYGLLILAVIACAILLWRTQDEEQPEPSIAPEDIDNPGYLQQLHWLALAFVPSSMLLGLTQFISTDIASMPLLWIVPLTIYLLSFILVFSRLADRIHPLMVMVQPALLLVFIAYSFINPAVLPYWLDLILHLLAFFLAIMVCHGELAKRRPHPRHLTRFYLVMSFGGMLGGLFGLRIPHHDRGGLAVTARFFCPKMVSRHLVPLYAAAGRVESLFLAGQQRVVRIYGCDRWGADIAGGFNLFGAQLAAVAGIAERRDFCIHAGFAQSGVQYPVSETQLFRGAVGARNRHSR
jgi:hypothetical protein